MPLAEAQALARELATAPHDQSANRQALEKLAEACERFAPCVALEEGDEPECLLMDISNLEHLWGSEANLAAHVENFFTRPGYHVRLAVANTVGLAWALAHFGIAECGVRIADYSQQSEIRNPKSEIELPVEALRIPDDTASLLRELGIQTVGQLQALPREDLTSRFGEQLLRRLDQLTGAVREVIEPHRALAALEVCHSLDEPTADRAVLRHVLDQLVKRLARRLAARDEGAVLLFCLLHSPGGTLGVRDGRGKNAQTMRIGLAEPSANAWQLLELIDLHLGTVTLSDEVNRVEIRVAVTGRLGERQRELFTDRWPTDPHQLALLVNRLSSRVGYERVLRPELRASPVPERAVRWVLMTQCREGERGRKGEKETKSRPFSSNLPLSPSPCLPLLLHPQLHPLEVVCIAPDGPPQFVWLDHHREQIMHCVGPERIETLWWRGPSVRRDYYRVATESGSHLWIFRRLTDARWFLHGEFA
jgi:protein ImuB